METAVERRCPSVERDMPWCHRLAFMLRIMRHRAGFTQAELAARVGTTSRTVRRVERGGQNPSAAMVQAWEEACGLRLKMVVL